MTAAYELPDQLVEFVGHFEKEGNECAWSVMYSQTAAEPTHCLPFIIRQCDLGFPIIVQQAHPDCALYGNRRFSLEFAVAVVLEASRFHVFMVRHRFELTHSFLIS